MDVTEGVTEKQQDAPDTADRSPSPEAVLTLSPFTGQSIEERLAAISESIRQWDWRTGDVASLLQAPRQPVPTTPAVHAHTLAATAPPTPAPAPPPPSAPLPPVPPPLPPQGPVPRHARPSGEDTGAAATEPPAPPTSSEAATGQTSAVRNPIRLQPPDFFDVPSEELNNIVEAPKRRFRRHRKDSPESNVHVETVAEPKVPEQPEPEPSAVAPPTATEPVATEEVATEQSAPPVKAPRRFGKLILVAVTVLIVVAIVEIIRSSATGPDSSNSLTPTTVTHTKSTSPPELIPVSSTVKADFTAASIDLATANAAVTRAVAGGTAQSPAQVAQEVAPYVTALNTFNFKTHYLAWPATLTVPAQDVTLRTEELIHFLSSISSTTPATLTSWFAQFHSLARLTESTDNALRKDIGLAATTSFPT